MPRRGYRARPRLDDQLEVECWCRSTVVFVDRKDVLAGRTGSCGHPWCKEPQDAA